MGKFEVNILGCGSALPTARHYPSTQILNIRDNLFMIDCGEGAQIQFRRMRLKFTPILRQSRYFGLNSIFSAGTCLLLFVSNLYCRIERR